MTSRLRFLAFAVLGLALVLVCMGARSASAQTLQMPAQRQGFYVSLGFGANGVGAWDKGTKQDFGVGPTFVVRLGEMLTDRWGLGLAFENGSIKKNGIASGIGGLTLETQARLWRNLSLHVGAGLGLAMVEDKGRVDDEVHATFGSLLTTAIAYDAFFTSRPSGGWAVTPSLGLRAVPGGDVDALAVYAALAITWWSGLPERELRVAK